MSGWLSSSPFSNFSMVECTSPACAVDLGGAAPHHDQAREALLLLEALDVGRHLVGQVALVLPLLDVLAAELLHVDGVEDRGPGLDRLQEGLERGEVLVAQHARLASPPRTCCRCRCPSRRRRCPRGRRWGRARRSAGCGCPSACRGARCPSGSGCRWAWRARCGSPPRRRRTSWPPRPCPGSRTPSFPFAGAISRPFAAFAAMHSPMKGKMLTRAARAEPQLAEVSGMRPLRDRNSRAAAVSSHVVARARRSGPRTRGSEGCPIGSGSRRCRTSRTSGSGSRVEARCRRRSRNEDCAFLRR